ncbi:hypothetical protein C0J52_08404 [Blattella germanica]|nr:hypothetical protein C0J52_08404 [Blattella germanica]
MERSPVISWLFHVRVLSLLIMLGLLDLHFVGHAYQSTVTKGASVQLVFGFEYAILLTIIINIIIKYALHTIDLNSENPWDNKAVFLLYTDMPTGQSMSAGSATSTAPTVVPVSQTSEASIPPITVASVSPSSTTSVIQESPSTSTSSFLESEGATGFTPESTATSSKDDPVSPLTKEQEEIRRRRIQKFGQTQNTE